jgi:ribosomal protein S18 acetylase RimI-like enzyme
VSIAYRPMRAGQEEAIAVQLRLFAKDLGSPYKPTITGDSLRKVSDMLHITVAENSGLLVGICCWTIIYSTWRGIKGVYVGDLFIMDHVRGKKVGENLLRAAARDSAKMGAEFIKLEVNVTNERAQNFYNRIGFSLSKTDRQMFLEPEPFNAFVGRSTA